MEKKFLPTKNYKFRLSRGKLFSLKKVFDIFDDDFDGVIQTSDLGMVMRAGGAILTDEEIETIIQEIDPLRIGTVDLATYLVIMTRRLRDADELQKIIKLSYKTVSFNLHERNPTTIPTATMRVALQDSLPADAADKFIRNVSEGNDVSIKLDNIYKAIFDDPFATENSEKSQKS